MVQLIPKSKKKREGFDLNLVWKNRQVFLVFGILIFLLGVYGALFFYEGSLNEELQATQDKIEDLRIKSDKSKEDAARKFGEKLDGVSLILDSHIYSSNLFTFIEALTHPKVQFTNLNFASVSGLLTLKGLTESYETFGEQMIALEKSGEIGNIKVSGVNLIKSGQVIFTVSFNVDEGIYK